MPIRIRAAASPVTPLIDQLRGWADERAELMARVAEIDEKVARVASFMGIAPTPNQQNGPKDGLYDFRRKGAMIEVALDILDAAPNGLTRAELKDKIGEHPVHGQRLKHNANGFYNMVSRALRRDEIVEHGDRLFVPGKGPSVDQPEIGAFDFTGTGGRPV